MGKLRAWADDQRDYIKMKDGDSIIVEFLGFKIVPGRLDPEKKVIRYTFGIDDKIKTFDSQSTALADLMDEIEEGQVVKITKTGEGFDTKYEVEPMKPAKKKVSTKKEASNPPF